ncbi:MAG TPA: hypothetical protein VM533_10950 [Fimbriiglobus sp.]|jgi:hypothetical protein|nr:hypothetical protein [Fimbriiglobus sp.]
MPRLLPVVLFAASAAVFAWLPVAPLTAQDKKAAPPAVPAGYPTLTTPASLGAKPGASVELVLTGTNLADATGVWTSFGGKAAIPDKQTDAKKLTVKLDVPADAKPGLHALRVATKAGVSNLRPICLDELPEVAEAGANKSRATPQTVPVPCVVTGKAETEAADYFKFPVQANKPITVEVLGRRLGSPIDPVVILYDGTGKELGGVYADDTPGLQSDARVVYVPKQSGELIAEVRDTTYRGGADYDYRLRIGSFPGATTAFPLAVGQSAKVGFSGPGLDGVKPVSVTAPTDPTVPVVYATPRRSDGPAGWPVPVRLSDIPEMVEREPNNDPKTANKLSTPGGVSARFAEKNDLDHFTFAAKKGKKVVIEALTYQVNAPTEVYLRILDAKGKELAKSNPQQVPTRVEFDPPADGDFTVACEHLNYLAGPSEVYHLSVTPAAPDFAVAVGLDRIDVPLSGVGLIPVTGLTKLNGFAGPVELTVSGSDALVGSLTVPAGANPSPTAPLFVPVTVKPGTQPGLQTVHLKATAKIDGKEVVRIGSVQESIKAALANLANPPAEFTTRIAAAVTPPPPFTLAVTFDKPEVAQGSSIKGKVTVTRGKGFADAVQLAAVGAPANVTAKLTPLAKLKPLAKGAMVAEFELTAAANAAAGPGTLVIRGTAGNASVVAPPVAIIVTPAKKKDEPKKKKD